MARLDDHRNERLGDRVLRPRGICERADVARGVRDHSRPHVVLRDVWVGNPVARPPSARVLVLLVHVHEDLRLETVLHLCANLEFCRGLIGKNLLVRRHAEQARLAEVGSCPALGAFKVAKGRLPLRLVSFEWKAA